MIYIKNSDRNGLIEAALGKRPCDLVIENGQLVNVLTSEIYPADIGIYQGFIAYIRANVDGKGFSEPPIEAKERFDAKGLFITPGLIDAHIHIESSMLTPYHFANASLVHGTTMVITDPHEIANVLGKAGVAYMVQMGQLSPQRQIILIPSCVPSVPGKEVAGALFSPEDIEEMLGWDNVMGIAEVMNYPGVLDTQERMMKIIEVGLKNNVLLQGHAPHLTDRKLSAYLASGCHTDHETFDGQEAKERLRLGMFVDARYGSISCNVPDIVDKVKNLLDLRRLTLCTDDKEPEDILRDGHLNTVVREAVRAGQSPVQAIQCATINVAEEVGYRNLGAIAPGFVADMVIFKDLQNFQAQAVFCRGKKVAENGKIEAAAKTKVNDTHPMKKIETLNSVHLEQLKEEDFYLKIPSDKIYLDASGQPFIRVRIMKYVSQTDCGTIWSDEQILFLDEKGQPVLPSDRDVKWVAVFHRHNKGGGRTVSLVEGFGTEYGAVASTISHDSHNLTIVYDSPKNALAAANKIIEDKGGMAAAREGKVFARIPLPIAGLLTPLPAEEISVHIKKMKEALVSLGLSQIKNPLLRIVTAALIVVPEVKISDLGVVDVATQEIRSIFL